MTDAIKKEPFISKTAAIVLVVICVLAIVFGCVFGIKCTVRLEHFYLVAESPELYEGNGWKAANASAIRGRNLTYMDIKVTRTSRFTPYIPERDGYEFKGWYQDTACTVPWISGSKVNHDITLYAKWEPVA